jgi:hypothetical protein
MMWRYFIQINGGYLMEAPSVLELKNTDKILDLLVEIEGISYKNLRGDILEITGPEGATCILDVEETLVCIGAEICDIPEDIIKRADLFKVLLDLNNEAIHGKFAINNEKIFFKENLEIENIDGNELEAALGWTLLMVIKSVEKISGIIE